MTFKSKLASAVAFAKSANNGAKEHQERVNTRATLINAGLKPMPEVNKTGLAVLIGAGVLGAAVAWSIVGGAGSIVSSWMPSNNAS